MMKTNTYLTYQMRKNRKNEMRAVLNEIKVHAKKMGRTSKTSMQNLGPRKYQVEIDLCQMLSKMGRILSDIRPLF